MTLLWPAISLFTLLGVALPYSPQGTHIDPLNWVAQSTPSQPLPRTEPRQSAIEAIQNCFVTYKKALLSKQGAIATSQVSRTTLDYYGKMRNLALRGEAKTVRMLSLSDQYLVLALRHRVGLKTLLSLTDKDVVSLAVQKGWIGESGLAETSIGKVTFNQGRAEAVLVINGKAYAEAPRFVFLKEQERWKIDITALLPTAEQFFQQWYAEDKANKNISTDTFLQSILELASSKKVSADIWQPLVR